MPKRKDIGGARRLAISVNEMAPTIMAGGIGSVNTSQYSLEESVSNQKPEKPPYQVPLMTDINALPWNGLNVVSTFSGCGGSCLGFKMAGFHVLWANEFIPAAQETYRANHPTTHLNTSDIRQIHASDIRAVIGDLDIDVLEGSPPCASFSTAGKREKGWGQVKPYSDTKQRVDDLFFEYARLVQELQPKVFVAENVSGLVKGTAKGYFLEILKTFKACGYQVECKLLDAQWLGVPQMRQRVIFIGVRNDLHKKPAYPKPLPYRYSVREALPWILEVRKPLGFHNEEYLDSDQVVASTVGASPASGVNLHNHANSVVAFRAIHDTGGLFSKGDITDEPCPAILIGPHALNSRHYQIEQQLIEPETNIEGYAIGKEWDKLGQPGTQSDKYLQLIRPDLDKPCNTVTNPPNSQFSKTAFQGSACVVHPTEKRKFSIAELKRICGFPDDFILTGTYAQQWERLGRAVPPVMMSKIAAVIRDEILCAE